MRQVNEERFVLVGFDEIDRLLGIAASNRSLVDRHFDDFLVLEQRRFPFGQRRLGIFPENVHALPSALRFSLVVRMVHVVRVRNTQVSVETVRSGKHFRMVAEMPFAETGRGVALGLQVIGQRVFVRIQSLFRSRE